MNDVQAGDTFWLRAMPGFAWEVVDIAGSTPEGPIALLRSGEMRAYENRDRLLDDRGSWVRVEHVLETVTA